jgi:pimeloyl-ACP methyl ester carboxylesterase
MRASFRHTLTFFLATGLLACGDASEPVGLDAGTPAADARVVEDAAVTEDAGGADDAGALADAGPLEGPAAPGTFEVRTSRTSILRAGRTTPVQVHVPAVPAGTAPLIVMMPGFQATHAGYTGTALYLAAHGYVVLQADPEAPFSLTGVDHLAMTMDVMAVIDWALGPEGPAEIDADRIGVTGHSLGGKIATMTAAADPRVDALFGIDPVDGGGPTGVSDTRPDIVPSQVTGLTVPVGFVGETADSAPGTFSCAPGDQNYARFYEAATTATWAAEWTVEGANHVSFLDSGGGSFCQPATAPRNVVLATTRTLATAFFGLHLRGDATLAPWLTGPRLPAGVVLRNRP